VGYDKGVRCDMEKKEILDTLSNVLGFNCSDFGEVIANSVVDGHLYDSLDWAKRDCESIKALATLLDYEDNNFKVYKRDDERYAIYTPKELESFPEEISEVYSEVA
jgi:hypothetical protein